MERVHSDGAIPPGRKYFLPMWVLQIWTEKYKQGLRCGCSKDGKVKVGGGVHSVEWYIEAFAKHEQNEKQVGSHNSMTQLF
jgi:hypothetical protein